ncbi:DUF342 domain-containing protein, partial [Gemmatimonadota bacterium]
KRPVDGKDSEIKYYFEAEIKPEIDDKGNVNYKELSLIQSVKKGDKLVEANPSTEGDEGCTIFGKNVPPVKGLQIPLPSGQNCKLDPSDSNILISEIDGCVKLKGKDVLVEPVIIIKEDIDYSTGNIDFCGSVVVGGDVKSGFEIIAEGDVEVNGIVEDAVIEAGGNVIVKMGFVGREKGNVTAGGEVKLLFCQEQTIVSGGDVYIGDYAMNSKIQTKGKLYATEKTGLIVGGETWAVQGVEAKEIGNDTFVPTKIYAGVDSDIEDKLKDIRVYLVELQKEIKKIKEKLQKLEDLKLSRGLLPRNLQSELDALKSKKRIKEEDNEEFISQLKNYDSELEEFKKAFVTIHDTVYPRVTITIFDKHIVVQESMKNLTYKYTSGGLISEPIKASEEIKTGTDDNGPAIDDLSAENESS